MTKTVIEMAREARLCADGPTLEALERFAALVREDAIDKFNRQMNQVCEEARLLDDGEKQQEPVAWMPIETAPRNSRILVTGTDIGTCVASAGWDNDTPDDIRWEVVNDIVVTPTHWMPIPTWNTTPPTASLAARQMRDAAVKLVLDDACVGTNPLFNKYLKSLATNIAALPVPSCASNASLEVQWRDLTDDEIDLIESDVLIAGGYYDDVYRAIIAKFKEANK